MVVTSNGRVSNQPPPCGVGIQEIKARLAKLGMIADAIAIKDANRVQNGSVGIKKTTLSTPPKMTPTMTALPVTATVAIARSTPPITSTSAHPISSSPRITTTSTPPIASKSVPQIISRSVPPVMCKATLPTPTTFTELKSSTIAKPIDIGQTRDEEGAGEIEREPSKSPRLENSNHGKTMSQPSLPVRQNYSTGEQKAHDAESATQIRAKILEALNRPSNRADSVVPKGGTCKPEEYKAIFIKSSDSKLPQIEQAIESSSTEEIQKSATLTNPLEAVSMTVPVESSSLCSSPSPSPSASPPPPPLPLSLPLKKSSSNTKACPNYTPIKTPELKAPQGVRKFHSWLSYFYSGGGKTSGNDTPPSEPIQAGELTETNNHLRASASLPSPKKGASGMARIIASSMTTTPLSSSLSKRPPPKGILKQAKPIGDLSMLPQPIQKTAFLRQEEVRRLTRFTERFKNRQPGQDVEDCLYSPNLSPLLEEEGSSISESDNDGEEDGNGLVGIDAFLSPTNSARSRHIRFNPDGNQFHETFSCHDYERGGNDYIAKSLTPEVAMIVKKELNELKKEMAVHEDSRCHTQFYQLR